MTVTNIVETADPDSRSRLSHPYHHLPRQFQYKRPTFIFRLSGGDELRHPYLVRMVYYADDGFGKVSGKLLIVAGLGRSIGVISIGS